MLLLFRKVTKWAANEFSPESHGEFDVDAEKDISQWQEKLNARFGLGTGKLRELKSTQTSEPRR